TDCQKAAAQFATPKAIKQEVVIGPAALRKTRPPEATYEFIIVPPQENLSFNRAADRPRSPTPSPSSPPTRQPACRRDRPCRPLASLERFPRQTSSDRDSRYAAGRHRTACRDSTRSCCLRDPRNTPTMHCHD